MKQSKQNSITFFLVALLTTIYTIYTIYQQRLSNKAINNLLFLNENVLSLSSSSTTSSLPLNTPLIYISTREGLTSRLRQLEIIYSNAQLFNRNITLINMPSVHYKQVGPINLCTLFVLPPSIKCISISPEQLTRSLNCTAPYTPDNTDSKWLYKPHNFGLRSFEHLLPSSQFSWNMTSCSLLWGFYFELNTKHSFPTIRFQSKYVRLFLSGLRQLRLSDSISQTIVDNFRTRTRALRFVDTKKHAIWSRRSNSLVKSFDTIISSDNHTQVLNQTTSHSILQHTPQNSPVVSNNSSSIDHKSIRPLWVFHWRRGDQADRCRRSEDNSVNCLPATALVKLILETVGNYTKEINHNMNNNINSTVTDTTLISAVMSMPVLVYVATNEIDPIALRTLQAADFRIFDDLGLKKSNQLSTLERFMVEVQMMIHADRFFGWGSTGVQTFVHRLRNERSSVK